MRAISGRLAERRAGADDSEPRTFASPISPSMRAPLSRKPLGRPELLALLSELCSWRVLRLSVLLASSALAVFSAGCTTIAQVSNLSEAQCDASFESQLSSILTEQGEKDEVVTTLAHRTYLMLTRAQLGPRPFLVASPSGTDYTFFVQKKRNRCLLRLYGRQKGFVSYTNNLTYISTRELLGCACQE
jgi:hypothetical protein